MMSAILTMTAAAAAALLLRAPVPSASTARGAVRMAAPAAYGAEQITVLEGLEPVRKRPGMYIGSTGPRGLHHLVFEVVDNSIDEALAGYATHIEIRLLADGSISISDDGRGIPCDVHAKTGRPAIETVLMVLHAGGKFGDAGYTVSSGLHGVGVSVVNALSSAMNVTVRRQGNEHRIAFAQGKLAQEMSVTPLPPAEAGRTGTTVVFQPDPLIFKGGIDFDFETLATRFDQQAYLHAGLNITMWDERTAAARVERSVSMSSSSSSSGGGGGEHEGDQHEIEIEIEIEGPRTVDPRSMETLEAEWSADAADTSTQLRAPTRPRGGARHRVFCHQGGIAEYVEHICMSKTPLLDEPETLVVTAQHRGVGVDIALRWNADMYSESLLGFANGVHTPQGGTHVDGLKSAIMRVLNAHGRTSGKLKEKSPNLPGDFLREGLVAIVSVRLQEAEFEGQTKNRLGNPEVRSIVSEVVTEALNEVCVRRPKALAAILDKAMAAAKAAEAAKAARELVRRKTVLGSSVLPGKLADCSSNDPKQSEVFIVEGDSAGGSAKQGRARETQAILPLRGKILNVEKADDAAMYGNTEIQALITALGLGVKGEEQSGAELASQLRYHRIIIMTDADVDGAHIRTLLLTFFYRYKRALIDEGYVYIAYPPLYKVRHRSKLHYCYSETELAQLKGQLKGTLTTQRFKGLGEMMPAELWSTTMDPGRRMLKQVTAEDAAEADRLLSVLMGNAIGPRKAFITEHADLIDWSLIDL